MKRHIRILKKKDERDTSTNCCLNRQRKVELMMSGMVTERAGTERNRKEAEER